jgi:hypothetical protein
VSRVACGLVHSAALSDDERAVLTGGWDEFGQLGHGLNLFASKNRSPRVVSGLVGETEGEGGVLTWRGKGVIEVACGSWHTLALAEGGDVFAWGVGQQGQLGLGWMKSKNTPTLVKALCGKGIVAIAASGCHTLAVTGGGGVFSWGLNSVGQLGLGDRDNRNTPTPLHHLRGHVVALVAAVGGLKDGHTLAHVIRGPATRSSNAAQGLSTPGGTLSQPQAVSSPPLNISALLQTPPQNLSPFPRQPTPPPKVAIPPVAAAPMAQEDIRPEPATSSFAEEIQSLGESLRSSSPMSSMGNPLININSEQPQTFPAFARLNETMQKHVERKNSVLSALGTVSDGSTASKLAIKEKKRLIVDKRKRFLEELRSAQDSEKTLTEQASDAVAREDYEKFSTCCIG